MYAVIQADCARAVQEKTYRRGRGDEALFWEAAAETCVALRSSNLESWQRATETWFGGGRNYAEHSCYVDAVRQSLDAVMGATPAPESLPNITLGPSAPGYACPWSDVRLEPSAGAAGTAVTLSWAGGPWMHLSGRVFFGDQEARSLLRQGEGFATLSAPDHAAGQVRVVLRFSNGTEADFGTFTYQ